MHKVRLSYYAQRFCSCYSSYVSDAEVEIPGKCRAVGAFVDATDHPAAINPYLLVLLELISIFGGLRMKLE